MTPKQLEQINKLIECFEKAIIHEDGLIHMTPELREQIVLMLKEMN